MSTLSRNRLLFRMRTSGPRPGILAIIVVTIATATTDFGLCGPVPWAFSPGSDASPRSPPAPGSGCVMDSFAAHGAVIR